MPTVSVYIRTEDYEKWQEIKNKAEFISDSINGIKPIKPKIQSTVKVDQLKEAPAELKETLKDYLEYRKQIKKPIVQASIPKFLKKLESMYPNDYSSQILAMEETIANGWQGVFKIEPQQSKERSIKL